MVSSSENLVFLMLTLLSHLKGRICCIIDERLSLNLFKYKIPVFLGSPSPNQIFVVVTRLAAEALSRSAESTFAY